MISDALLAHMVKAPSQYDATCRALAEEVIELRARVESLRVTARSYLNQSNVVRMNGTIPNKLQLAHDAEALLEALAPRETS